MKRSKALKLIANQLDFLSGRFTDVRDEFSSYELSNADVILSTLEDAGMKPSFNEWDYNNDGDHANSNDVRYYTWEKE